MKFAEVKSMKKIHFSIWAQAIQEVYRCQPTSLASLKSLADEFAANIDEENVRKIVHNVKKRAAICRD